MPRDTARKVETSPNLVHIDVLRNSAGTVQMTGVTTTTGHTQTGTVTNTPFSTTINDPGLVAFTSATISGSGGGAGNAVTINLIRDGATIASTTGTGAVTSAISNTHTTPLNAPQYSVQVISNGGTATASFSLSREQRLA